MGRTKFIFLLLAAIIFGMVFVALNPQRVPIELAFFHVQSPIGLALVIALVVGLIVGGLMRGAWVAELLNERGRLRRALKAAEARARTQAGDLPPGSRSL